MASALSVGGVIADTFAILRRGGATLAALAALLLGLPQLLPAAVAVLKPASPGAAAVATVVLGIVFSAAATRAALDAAAGAAPSFARSRELTRGHRWRVRGLFPIDFAVSFALFLPVLLVEVAFPARGMADLWAGLENTALDAATVLAEAGSVALYAALRRIVDGAPAAALAEAFR